MVQCDLDLSVGTSSAPALPTSKRITLEENPTNSFKFSIKANETSSSSNSKIDPKSILNNKEIKIKFIDDPGQQD
jgi:hypothetical protein